MVEKYCNTDSVEALRLKKCKLERDKIELQENNLKVNRDLLDSRKRNRELETDSIFYVGEQTNYSSMNLCQLKEAKKKAKLRFHDIEEARKRANSQLAAIDVREDELETAAAEERLCVVCKEEAKKVVLMPCRHFCLCRACAYNPLLKKCPLCRESVVSKNEIFI